MDGPQPPEVEPAAVMEHQQPSQQPEQSPEQSVVPSELEQASSEVLIDSPAYSNGQSGHLSSHSAPDYVPSPPSQQYVHDTDQSSRWNSSPTMTYQQPPQPISRPGSGLSSGGDRYAYSQPYQEQPQRQQTQQPTKNSVVIKVGMVGDAQIGKTSLMVKYVEGSWDEDYIQTLGKSAYSRQHPDSITEREKVSISWRRLFQFETPRSHFPSGI